MDRFSFDLAELDHQRIVVTFDYSPPTPDVMYLANGDPGYQGDPEEISIVAVAVQLKQGSAWVDSGVDLAPFLTDSGDLALEINAAIAEFLDNMPSKAEQEFEAREEAGGYDD